MLMRYIVMVVSVIPLTIAEEEEEETPKSLSPAATQTQHSSPSPLTFPTLNHFRVWGFEACQRKGLHSFVVTVVGGEQEKNGPREEELIFCNHSLIFLFH